MTEQATEVQDAILFFDAETTGIPEYKLPSEDPCQPHMVEIAGLLYSTEGVLLDSFEAIIKPNGWVIADEVAAIHGITTEIATEQGVPEEEALQKLLALHSRAGLRVAHNRSFDDRIIRIALKRYRDDDAAEAYKAAPGACTALLSKPICQLPPTEAMKKTNFKNSFKTPDLAEALRHFTGQEHAGSHRAMADAQACARIYFAIQGVRMQDFPADLDHLAPVQA